MTPRHPSGFDAELRAPPRKTTRSVHQEAVHAIETYLWRETAAIKADSDTLRAPAEAREAVRAGEAAYSTEVVRTLRNGRRPLTRPPPGPPAARLGRLCARSTPGSAAPGYLRVLCEIDDTKHAVIVLDHDSAQPPADSPETTSPQPGTGGPRA